MDRNWLIKSALSRSCNSFSLHPGGSSVYACPPFWRPFLEIYSYIPSRLIIITVASKSWWLNIINTHTLVRPCAASAGAGLCPCRNRGLFLCVALSFPRSSSSYTSSWEKVKKVVQWIGVCMWGGGDAPNLQMAFVSSFPISLARTQPHGHTWEKLWNVFSCGIRRKAGFDEFLQSFCCQNECYTEGGILFCPSQVTPWLAVSLLLLVCWVRHLEKLICACFSLRDNVLLIVRKIYLRASVRRVLFFSCCKKCGDRQSRAGGACLRGSSST